MELIIIIPYSLSLLYIFLFSLSELHLTWIYIKNKNKKTEPIAPPIEWKQVTIQLPVYNEKYVIERLLDAVLALDYPKEKLEIQVLDDSTDETRDILERKVKALDATNSIIKIIHRNNRNGFKAGALAHGLSQATGTLIAIFDADFLPEPDFLKRTVPYFEQAQIGAVQTRWGHINPNYSLLTQLQAFGLDAHFSIEQSARNAAGSFINFNGTCGIWRKFCIEDAGGWSDDTLTEDLDLSYRAQLKGWKFKYLEDVAVPGELPVIMTAIKSQQYRWNKGGAETARKIFGPVLRSNISFLHKVHAFFHLFNSSVFIALLIAALTSLPMLWIKMNHPEVTWLFRVGGFFLLGFMSISFFYWTATKRFHKKAGRKFLYLFPNFLIISMGLSLHNGIAVLEGLIGIKTPFIRTPKFNIKSNVDTWKNSSYINPTITISILAEGILCIYFLIAIALGQYFHDNTLLVFHLMLALGYGAVFYHSVKTVRHA